MIGRWTRKLLWGPYESLCRRYPLIPFHGEVTEPVDGVLRIRVHNAVVRALSRLSGGYDYSVSYLVDGELLIDTGFPWARRTLKSTLEGLRGRAAIRVVVNTHYHEDHTGNNDLLQELGARILAHADAVPEIRFPPRLPWYRRFLFGPPPVVDVEVAPDELRTTSSRFRVLHMPGHCPGRVCLFEPDRRWLFGGDLYIAPDLDTQLADANGPDWIESLDRAIALRPAVLFDAHGLVVQGEREVSDHLERKREFLVALRDLVKAESHRARSVQAITRSVFSGSSLVNCLSQHEGWMSLLTASDFSRSNLVKTFLAETASARVASDEKRLPTAFDR